MTWPSNGRFRVNDDGTVDWVNLTGHDLAAVFHACARSRFALAHSRDAEHVERVAYEALGGCMSAWEAQHD